MSSDHAAVVEARLVDRAADDAHHRVERGKRAGQRRGRRIGELTLPMTLYLIFDR
jgi:hypothetical protein